MISVWERWSRRLIGLGSVLVLAVLAWFSYTNGHWQVIGHSNESQTGIAIQNVDTNGLPSLSTFCIAIPA